MNRCSAHIATIAYRLGFAKRFRSVALAAVWWQYAQCSDNAQRLRVTARRLWSYERRYVGVAVTAQLSADEAALAIAACEFGRASEERDGDEPQRMVELCRAAIAFVQSRPTKEST